ncbi:hypothetical protein HDU85_000316 [Gaertneriomyces sp. JEL0708]|nr:hypothetical protein HDU85_000316 [Gaertneriomyces sp. JEL0708]
MSSPATVRFPSFPVLSKTNDSDSHGRSATTPSDYSGLALSRETADRLLRAIERSDTGQALELSRKALGLRAQPPPLATFADAIEPFNTCPSEEDLIARDDMLARYMVDLFEDIKLMDLAAWQWAVWITVMFESHTTYIAQVHQKHLDPTPEAFLETFMNKLVEHNYGKYSCRPFTRQECTTFLDYISESYGKHVKLLTYVFSEPQDIDTSNVEQHYETPDKVLVGDGKTVAFVSQPLSKAIPAEKWEDWCRAQEEEKRLEQERIEQAKRDARQAAEAAEAQQAAEAAAVNGKAQEARVEGPSVPKMPTLHARRLPMLPDLPPQYLLPFASSPTACVNSSDQTEVPMPSTIAQILSHTLEQHITLLATSFEVLMDQQLSDMQAILDFKEVEKKAKGEVKNKEDKTKAKSAKSARGKEATTSSRKRSP